MYVVFLHGKVAYLGDEQQAAVETLNGQKGGTMHSIADLGELGVLFAKVQSERLQSATADIGAELADALDDFILDIEKLGVTSENIEKVRQRVVERTKQEAARLKRFGKQSLLSLGSVLKALGATVEDLTKD